MKAFRTSLSGALLVALLLSLSATNGVAQIVTSPQGIEFVAVSGGTFTMGEAGPVVGPPHQVTLTNDYVIGRYEVTQAQFESVMGYNPSRFSGDPSRPVERVGWSEALAFANALSVLEGLTPCYSGVNPLGGDIYACEGYRLPTEAEWEFAARAGTSTYWSYGDNVTLLDDHAWYRGNAGGQTHPVGSKQPNPWGLYDVHGNVREWANDTWGRDYYQVSPSVDPAGPPRGSGIGLAWRGGAYLDSDVSTRSAMRQNETDQRFDFIGFRLARTSVDTDGDGVGDASDNCLQTPNPDQEDLDLDLVGDACDGDIDGDGFDNYADVFPTDPSEWADNDGDGIGDNADVDDDDDGQSDVDELACGSDPMDAFSMAPDLDGDSSPDCVDADDDDDGTADEVDNCPLVANADQADFDGDGIGNTCDTDIDGDGIGNSADMCAATVIPEGSVPSVRLGANRWALVDGNTLFDTVTKGKGEGSGRSYTTEDTAGCSCEQIIEATNLGQGHGKFGCSNSAMDDWIVQVAAGKGLAGAATAEADSVPTGYELAGNYPNPFNPETTISFGLPEQAHIRLRVFDLLGRTVATLANGEYSRGTHSVRFDAEDLPSGMYLYSLFTPAGEVSKLMVLQK